jgi:hypothetical protein
MDLSSHGTVAPVLASGEMYRTISSSPRSLVLSQYYIVLKSWLISSRSRNVVPGRVGGISVEGKPKRLRSRPAQQREHLGSCGQQKNKKRSGNMNKTSGKQELIVWSSV